jgi:hypothetical protein
VFIGFKSIDYFAVASDHKQARRRHSSAKSACHFLRLTLGHARDTPASPSVKLAGPIRRGTMVAFYQRIGR